MQAYSPLGSADSPFLKDLTLKAMADKYNASVSQILISWQRICSDEGELTLVARGVCVLPKSVTPSRIKENFTTVELTEEDIAILEGFAEKNGGERRFIDPPWGKPTGWQDGLGSRRISELKSEA